MQSLKLPAIAPNRRIKFHQAEKPCCAEPLCAPRGLLLAGCDLTPSQTAEGLYQKAAHIFCGE